MPEKLTAVYASRSIRALRKSEPYIATQTDGSYFYYGRIAIKKVRTPENQVLVLRDNDEL